MGRDRPARVVGSNGEAIPVSRFVGSVAEQAVRKGARKVGPILRWRLAQPSFPEPTGKKAARSVLEGPDGTQGEPGRTVTAFAKRD